MDEEKIERNVEKKIESCCESWGKDTAACGGFVYFLGAVGAVVYYVSAATGFWTGVLGVLKALVWPAFLVYELLKFLGV